MEAVTDGSLGEADPVLARLFSAAKVIVPPPRRHVTLYFGVRLGI